MNTMDLTSLKTKLMIGGIIIAIGLYLGWSDYSAYMEGERQSQLDEIGKLETDIKTKEGELKRLANFASNIEKIKDELTELNLQLETALEHMPRSFNLSSLLRKLTLLAQNSGVSITRFKPSSTESKEKGQFYSQVEIDFELTGTFTQTLTFLDQLTRLKRIVNINTLKLTTGATPEDKAGSVVARTVASMSTFRFDE